MSKGRYIAAIITAHQRPLSAHGGRSLTRATSGRRLALPFNPVSAAFRLALPFHPVSAAFRFEVVRIHTHYALAEHGSRAVGVSSIELSSVALCECIHLVCHATYSAVCFIVFVFIYLLFVQAWDFSTLQGVEQCYLTYRHVAVYG